MCGGPIHAADVCSGWVLRWAECKIILLCRRGGVYCVASFPNGAYVEQIVARNSVYYRPTMVLRRRFSPDDVFMAGIEAITNSTYKRKIARKDNQGNAVLDNENKPVFDYEDTLIWNPAVANLTLMALGSSTPEILLSIIEIVGASFFSGDLGPGTVVGSASFNLYVITAMCMVALPAGEGRKIDGLTTYCITAFHSLFAYLWLAISLVYISPDVVEPWEALITLGCFPWLTFWVWAADNNWFRKEKVHPEDEEEGTAMDKVNGEGGEGAIANGNGTADVEEGIGRTASASSSNQEASRFSSTRQKNNNQFRHRHNALSTFMGGKRLPETGYESEEVRTAKELAGAEKKQAVFNFDAAHYAFLETVGEAVVKVVRGGKIDEPATVNYESIDGTAKAGEAYVGVKGTLEFEPNETDKTFAVNIIHDKVHNPDLAFKLALSA
eukprot:CAMPEP_0181300562 /NCGR_PEP_ID=MMETSP1101-20121128/6955_1 /TAXON_ID=46948 /ORGANISM="Rhodomonas abbreviata, Strain Caron Lab Isolate" /LENGTH=439 /DNA_ID=CAMNT_0023405805 /DNA_START=402 /DNA_END=1719 /DNA_ORIENTATION=-